MLETHAMPQNALETAKETLKELVTPHDTAANAHNDQLASVVVLFVAAVFFVAIFKRLQLSPVLGYLVAGILIGPYGLSVVNDVASTHYIAEFGVVFLLFMIGLELTFERLLSMRRHVFGYGTLQVLITGLIFGLFAFFYADMEAKVAFIVGGGLALSSTAIVLQVIAEKGQQHGQVGRLSLATLILQDLAVVPLLLMVPLLADDSNDDLGQVLATSLFQGFIALVVIFIIGKQLLRPFFSAIASLKSEELFVATTLLIVLGTAWATNELGLSLALGAFVAGLLVAETEYAYQVEADIKPFKGLLMGLFFMTIGMQIDLSYIMSEFALIVVLTLILILVKTIIIFILSRSFGFKSGVAISTALTLAQGSEFTFVLFGLALEGGLMSSEEVQLLLVVVSISMAITPLLASLGNRISKNLDKNLPESQSKDEIERETHDLQDHVVVAGFGRVGKTTCKLLAMKEIHYVALDENPQNVHEGRKESQPVYFGDAGRIEILESIGIARARLVAVTMDNRKTALRVVKCIHKKYPDLIIIARARDRAHAAELREAGAYVALAEMFESSLLLGGAILKETGEADAEVERTIERFRAEEYPARDFREIFHHDPEVET